MKYLPTIDTHKLTCTLMGTCLLLSSSCSVDPSPSESDMADVEMSRSTQEYHILQHSADRLLVALPNRMIVIAQELRTTPVVATQVWVKTGSIYEQEHVGAGLSHFLEHLASGGTTANRSEEESTQILGHIGAQPNAATGLSSVRYYITSTRPYTEQAIDLLSDWMQNSLITPTEYARERDVIQREFDMGRGEPRRIFWKLTQQARYLAHPARHPTIGYIDAFLNVSREQIVDFYRRMYVPNNMVFVVVGDIDKQRVVDQIARLWQDVQPRDLPDLSFPVEPQLDRPRHAQDVADIQRPRVRLAWPGTALAESGDYALDLLGIILGGGESSRLVRNVRDDKRLVNTIDAYNLSFDWGKGFFGIDAEVVLQKPPADAAQAIEKVKAAILEQVQVIQADGVTEAELARAKRVSMARVVYSAQTAHGLAGQLASNTIAMHDPDYMHHYAQRIQDITGQELQDAANRFLVPQRLINITLLPAPDGHELEPLRRPDPNGQEKNWGKTSLTLDNQSILDDLHGTQIDDGKRDALAQKTVRKTVLPNGLRLLIGRSTVVPAVAMQLYHLGGLLSDEPGREGVANATASMLVKGTTTRSAQQIAQQIEDLGARFTSRCGNNTFFVRALCLEQDWRAVLKLLADVILEPTFPDDEWQKMQPRLLAAIDRSFDQWHGELRNRFRELYFGSHPWSQQSLGRREVVASLQADDLRHFYRQRLAASQAVLAIVGDVDPDDVIQHAQSLFSQIPSAAPVPFKSTAPIPPAPRRSISQTNKPVTAIQIGFGPGVTVNSPDYPAMRMLSNVLSSFPSGWLEQELRGRGPGLVYAVGAGNFVGLEPGYFSIMFNTEATQVSEALRRAMAVVERARTETIDNKTLARAKATILTDEFTSKQSLENLATDVAINELYGKGLDYSERFLETVQQMDARQLRQAAAQYLRNPVLALISNAPISQETLDDVMTRDTGILKPLPE